MAEGQTTLDTVAQAVHGLVVAIIALADPEEVVLGGSWGRDQAVVEALTRCLASSPRAVPVRVATTEAPTTPEPGHEPWQTCGPRSPRARLPRTRTSQAPKARRASRSPSAQS